VKISLLIESKCFYLEALRGLRSSERILPKGISFFFHTYPKEVGILSKKWEIQRSTVIQTYLSGSC